MDRREAFRLAAVGSAGAGLLGPRAVRAEARAAQAVRGLPSPKITDVRAIATAPAGLRLVVVKITTDQDGLYGYGCATFTQRADLVVPAVDRYLKPFLLGKPADRIEDTWQALYDSSYWRNGPVLNNAISGVDQALWDIKGRQAGMPVYQLLGGKAREAADCYAHASGAEIAEVVENARGLIAQGFRHVRIQVGVPGMAGYGSRRGEDAKVKALHDGAGVRARGLRAARARALRGGAQGAGRRGRAAARRARAHLADAGAAVLQGRRAASGCSSSRIRVSPEDIGWFRLIRQQYDDAARDGGAVQQPARVDAADRGAADRLHPRARVAGGRPHAVPQDGGARARLFGVKTAWHGPGDVSPIGHACNVTLDLACSNFGIQESVTFNEQTREVFSGCPELREGYLYANEAPGWGIEVDERAAAKYPFGHRETGERERLNGGWGEVRRRDGTLLKQ